MNLSTTTRGADELSSRFADNVGPDDTVVFAGFLAANANGGHPPGPEPFTFWIPLTHLFFYEPTLGNLLLDIRIIKGNTNTFATPMLDAWDRSNDSVSSVLRGDVNASTGLVETVGLVTEFQVWPNPKLGVQQRNDSVVLTWPANPPDVGVLPETVLQRKQDFALAVQWQAITNGVMTSNFVSTYTIPLESADATAYFRLLSTTPP